MPALRGRPGGHVLAAGEEGAPKSDAGTEPAGGDAAERAPFWEGGLLDGADLHADEQGAEHVQGRHPHAAQRLRVRTHSFLTNHLDCLACS